MTVFTVNFSVICSFNICSFLRIVWESLSQCKIYGGSFLKSKGKLEGQFENLQTSLKMVSLPSKTKVINDQPPYTCPKTKICSYSYSYSYTIYRSPHALQHLKVIPILRSPLTDNPPSPGKVDLTTGVYVPYSFSTVVWVLLRPTRTR